MTLDMAQVGARLHSMGEHLHGSQADRHARLQRTRAYFGEVASDWQRLADDARRGIGSGAAPLEPLDAVHPRPPTPAAYEVLATDGSTIEPDRHGPAMCAVINVGSVRIRYGVAPDAY